MHAVLAELEVPLGAWMDTAPLPLLWVGRVRWVLAQAPDAFLWVRGSGQLCGVRADPPRESECAPAADGAA